MYIYDVFIHIHQDSRFHFTKISCQYFLLPELYFYATADSGMIQWLLLRVTMAKALFVCKNLASPVESIAMNAPTWHL